MRPNRDKPPDDGAPRVPVWIVSFSDMVTLLLSFFVLLQAFAKQQDPELFFAGQGSFKRALEGFGLPGLLLGREQKPRRDFRKLQYPAKPPEDALKPKQFNAEDDQIRKAFDDLRDLMDVESSDVVQETVSIHPTDIRFAPSGAVLHASAKVFLNSFAFNLGQNVRAQPMKVKVYVIGLAAEGVTRKRQWLLSARRARAVEENLRGALVSYRPARDWDVCSWGAGPGGQWCRDMGVIPEQTQIVIAISRG